MTTVSALETVKEPRHKEQATANRPIDLKMRIFYPLWSSPQTTVLVYPSSQLNASRRIEKAKPTM